MTSTNDERRPGAEAASQVSGDTSSVQPIGDVSLSTRRKYWARRYIDRGTATRPQYGSPAWSALPDGHPDLVAACVVAAECWAQIADDLEESLRCEIEQLRVGHKREEDAEYARQAAEHRERSQHRVSKSFVQRRAEQLSARDPRPGDHPGGPGRPWGGAS